MQVASGCKDGTVRGWDADSGETILSLIKICRENMNALLDITQIATGGFNESAVRICDAKTGKLLSSIEHTYQLSLVPVCNNIRDDSELFE